MLYTIIWLILFLAFSPNYSLQLGSHWFWALVVAIIADVFWNFWYRGAWRRAP